LIFLYHGVGPPEGFLETVGVALAGAYVVANIWTVTCLLIQRKWAFFLSLVPFAGSVVLLVLTLPPGGFWGNMFGKFDNPWVNFCWLFAACSLVFNLFAPWICWRRIRKPQ